ncbi:hypothetical protein [Evansella tamaricis]|uniref:50S ribosomal protein L29 n=1 Tax=Evansella tamaricis TaxID=2069301 RepID=A0ABS6JBM7_9BACI|nr:hypothetical protein [Evansella tamaricis]MBU9711081.1 hypothetical protein [Evansella tamaricis]
MKISHEEYLKQLLQSLQSELNHLDIEHRISIAEHNVRRKMIMGQINSIERQLNNSELKSDKNSEAKE